MNKLYCNDGCRKQFPLTKINTGMETLERNIEHHYIECPHCKQKYTSYYMDDQMKQIQLQIQALREKEPLKIKQKNRLNKLIRRMTFMHDQLKMKVEQGELQ